MTLMRGAQQDCTNRRTAGTIDYSSTATNERTTGKPADGRTDERTQSVQKRKIKKRASKRRQRRIRGTGERERRRSGRASPVSCAAREHCEDPHPIGKCALRATHLLPLLLSHLNSPNSPPSHQPCAQGMCTSPSPPSAHCIAQSSLPMGS